MLPVSGTRGAAYKLPSIYSVHRTLGGPPPGSGVVGVGN
jgi:hypothetical protein